MDKEELKQWLNKTMKELESIKLPIESVYYGLIQGSLLMIEMVLEKMKNKE